MFCIDLTQSAHGLANDGAVYLSALAGKYGDCLRARYADEIEPPRYAAQRVTWEVDGADVRNVRRMAETARRLAILAARSERNGDDDKAAQCAHVILEMVNRAQSVDPSAVISHGAGMQRDGDSDSRGHGVDNRSAWVRETGAGERVRDNDREIGDNDMKQADYAASGSVSYNDILLIAKRQFDADCTVNL